MEDCRLQLALRACELHRRGILTTREACYRVVCEYTAADNIAEILSAIPAGFRGEIARWLSSLPTSDEDWSDFELIGGVDGDEETWRRIRVEGRAAAEVAKAYFESRGPA